MLLQGTNAVIYGVGDSLGGAVARAFAQAGACVFASARQREHAEAIAEDVRREGGSIVVDQVDALDRHAVSAYVERVKSAAGSVDVSFSLINMQDTQDIPLVDMELEDFVRPVRVAMETQFITATAAARFMREQRSGLVLSLTATPGGIGYPNVGGFGPACCAIEAFSRNLASELGPFGVRAVNLRSAGSLDSRPFREARAQGGERTEAFFEKLKADTMLKDMPAMADIAQAAVFVASPHARMITGVTLDITAGTTSALNYKVPEIAFVAKPGA